MDYDKIIFNGIIYVEKFSGIGDKHRWEALKDYFVREARKAERDEFIMPERFIKDCMVHAKALMEIKTNDINDKIVCLQVTVEFLKAIVEAGIQLKKEKEISSQPATPKFVDDCRPTEHPLLLGNTTNRTSKIKQKLEKSFSNYLHHHNKEALMEKLHELLDYKDSGIHVATVLEALKRKNYLLQRYSTPKLISEFNLLCTKQSINKYIDSTVEKGKGMLKEDEIQRIISVLP